MKLIERLTILSLCLIILGLVYKLLVQGSVATTTPDKPRERDLFNYAQWPERQQQYAQEIKEEADHEERMKRISK